MKTSLPERSEHVTEQLTAVTEVIRELVGNDLAMLILFGSYARGDWVRDRYVEDNITYTYESDFDLLIVSENRVHATVDGEARLCDAIGRRLRQQGLDRPSSTIIAEDIEHLNKDLQRGNYFYSDIKKEGVLLFDSRRHTLAEAGPFDPIENQKYAREDFEHWFTSACEFLDSYQFNFDRGCNNTARFPASSSHRTFLPRDCSDVHSIQAQNARS